MRCRYCNIALAPLRSLADDEFCCDDHRDAFYQQQAAPLPAPSETVDSDPPVVPELPAFPILLPPSPAPEEPALEQMAQPVEEFESLADSSPDVEPSEPTSSHPGLDISAWKWIRTAWKGTPRDLKLVTVLLPVLAALAVTGSFPKVPIKTAAPAHVAEVEKAVNEHWKNFTQTISNRAAIAYADDFRSGLDGWESRSNLTTSWSYDAAGFVRPGPLAVFKPTLDLVDYRFEFLGEIDQRAMGWVFRAQDLNNYYAMKFAVVKPGPLPLIDMVRYAVINGKEGPHVHKPLPMTVRADMLYRVLVDVRGADFTVIAQGQVVDFWTDYRLQHGGVGFFSNRGERARLRWVEVSHQFDALGRACAYLEPYGIEGRNGNFN
jgi:hypothetical protein